MRLQKVKVRGLFGLFDHDISFRHGESVAIIHGPNGFGKTVMLRMLNSLVSGQEDVFIQTPFREFSLLFDDGSQRLARRDTADASDAAGPVVFSDIRADGKTTKEFRSPRLPKRALSYIDRYISPRLQRRGDLWVDEAGKYYSIAQVARLNPRLGSALRELLAVDIDSTALPPLADFAVFFVETGRIIGSPTLDPDDEAVDDGFLLSERKSRRFLPPRVVQYSKELTRCINATLAAYARHSQESDRTFPERLVQFLRHEEPALSNTAILSQMKELEQSRQRLINLGFLDTETSLADLTVDDVKRAPEALTIYVCDVRQKLAVFDDMVMRVGKLTDIINDMFRYKHLAIDREHGFHIRKGSDTIVDLADLSSGEQHQLVMLYELLFRVPRNGLVLIDEPEISLHVSWQTRFLQDLIDILEITKAHSIIATHAPGIISSRWDLTVQLRGPSPEGQEEAC